MTNKMTERLKTAIGEEEPKHEQPKTRDAVMQDLAEQIAPVGNDSVPNEMVATVKELPVPVIEASLTDFEVIIEEKNAIIQDLLVKNAELAGFIDGIKFIRGWLAE